MPPFKTLPFQSYLDEAGTNLNRAILVLNQYFPPDVSATAAFFEDLVESLSRKGYSCTVLAGQPSYGVRGQSSWRLFSRDGSRKYIVERVGSSSLDRRRIFARVLNYLSFLLLVTIRSITMPKHDAVIVGTDPPFAILSALVAARGSPVIYYLMDLHPDFAIKAGMMKPGIITRFWELIHVFGMRRAAAVVCLGDRMAERVQELGVSSTRIHVVPLGARRIDHEPQEEVVQNLRAKAPFVVLHAGNLGGSGAWESLVTASQMLGEAASFVFVGEGFNADRLREAGIRVLPFFSKEQVPSVMAAGDLQIVTLRKGMQGLVVPSKLYAILAHGRPVLAVVPEESEVAQVVSEWQCGLLANPDDPQDICDKVNFALSNPERLREMSEHAAEAGRHFDRDRLLAEFVGIVRERMQQGKSAPKPDCEG